MYTKRTIHHDEALQVAQRLINSHFRQEPGARIGIPARPDYDDDLLIKAYIYQQQKRDEGSEGTRPSRRGLIGYQDGVGNPANLNIKQENQK